MLTMSPRRPIGPAKVSLRGATQGTYFMASSLETPLRYEKYADRPQPGPTPANAGPLRAVRATLWTLSLLRLLLIYIHPHAVQTNCTHFC